MPNLSLIVLIMLWIKALHIISMVAWFSGLFYLPRLFVYHAEATDKTSIDKFKIMEKRLLYIITTPAAILTSIFGIWLLYAYAWQVYKYSGWLHAKLGLIAILYIYHAFCNYYVNQFNNNANQHSSKFYRVFNEIPTILLISIVILAVTKPF